MTVRLGYVFIFVPDVPAAVQFFERAFGLECQHLDASGMFAELATGDTVLAFAEDDYASSANGIAHQRSGPAGASPGISFTFVSDDVPADWHRAVEAGAEVVATPTSKPWGQVVGYLRDPHGLIIEIASTVDYPDA